MINENLHKLNKIITNYIWSFGYDKYTTSIEDKLHV